MEDHCAVMETLSNSLFLRLTLVVSLFSSLLAFPLVLFASYSLACARVSKLFHINIIFIFQMHLFGFGIHCFSRIILHSLDLYNYAFQSYCDMAPSTYRCFFFRLLYVTGLWIVSASTVPLIIERLVATKKSASYEHIGCALGVLMVLLQICLAILATLSSFLKFKFDDPVMNYCMALKPGVISDAEKISAGNLVIQVVARIIFQYLFKVNEASFKRHAPNGNGNFQKLRAAQLTSSLSNRYSLEQNLKSMRTLKIFADLQSVFMILHMSLFILILKIGPEVSKSTYISLVELNAQYPLYAIVSIIVILKKAHLNRVKLKKKLAIHVHTDKDVYFENFKKDLS